MKATTEEQLDKIREILDRERTCYWFGDGEENEGLYVDDYISFDEMARIVDYLRSLEKGNRSLDLSTVDPRMREPVETWLAYKKEKRQSYKPTGFKTFYKKLCELSNNNPQVAMAIIEQSMQNNYAGIFPLKNNNNGYGRETITDKIRRTVEEADRFSQKLGERIGGEADVRDGDNPEVW